MRDYLEELLDLLTQEDEEEAAGVWETQTASLILPKALEAEAPEGALELPEGVTVGDAGSGESGERPWLERELVPGLDTAPDQNAALSDSPGELDEALASGGERPVMGEDGPAETGAVLLEQIRSRSRPALLQQAQDLERQAGQAQALVQDRRSRSLASALALPSRGQASFPSQMAEGNGGGQNAGGTAWPGGEDQARLIDRAFQRDSRRYDRGFSLY
ncbi:MAG: hypothetical protein KH443_04150 [Oscillospiraceae bacterium]|nr:hypothetical protein [Oscillospiraceae bacterium]